jgi:hypothetical protein
VGGSELGDEVAAVVVVVVGADVLGLLDVVLRRERSPRRPLALGLFHPRVRLVQRREASVERVAQIYERPPGPPARTQAPRNSTEAHDRARVSAPEGAGQF